MSFHRRVRRAYRARAAREPGRFHVLDARRPIPTLLEEILADLLPRVS